MSCVFLSILSISFSCDDIPPAFATGDTVLCEMSKPKGEFKQVRSFCAEIVDSSPESLLIEQATAPFISVEITCAESFLAVITQDLTCGETGDKTVVDH